MISTFKVGTAGCGGRGGCVSSLWWSGVSPANFVLYLHNLPYEALSSTL